jgi:serine/threonine protein kinase
LCDCIRQIDDKYRKKKENFYFLSRRNKCVTMFCDLFLFGVQLLVMALDAARGLQHLHKHGIVHRDLAARNLLMTAQVKRWD